jgi:hypothetical protein
MTHRQNQRAQSLDCGQRLRKVIAQILDVPDPHRKGATAPRRCPRTWAFMPCILRSTNPRALLDRTATTGAMEKLRRNLRWDGALWLLRSTPGHYPSSTARTTPETPP